MRLPPSASHPHSLGGACPNMLLALPQELQATVVVHSDVTSAGRLAQVSHACKHLGQQHSSFVLAKRKELSDMAATKHKPGSRSAAVFAHFESLDYARPFRYHCWCSSSATMQTAATPCAIVLKVQRSTTVVACLLLWCRTFDDLIQ